MATQVSGHVHIVKRKRGDQWYMKYRLPSGKQVQKKLGPVWTERSRPPAGYFTKKLAEEALRAVLTDAQRGVLPDPGNSSGKTFGDAVAEWLRYLEHDKARKPSTLRDYRTTAYGSLEPEFGSETPLEKITPEKIEAYRQRRLSEVSRRMVQKQMVLLHGVLERAKALKWIRTNPVDEVERVSVRRSGEFNVLTAPQVEAVARKADGLFASAIIVAAYTGLRTGEVRALRWRDVDFAGSLLRVQRNNPIGGDDDDSPKSGKVRSVPLVDDAARELDALSRREHFVGPDDLVFTKTGQTLRGPALREALYEAMEAAGIDREAFPAGEGFTFHDLRHTFGTLAAQVWPLHDVQAFMGHANIDATMIFAHHVPKQNAAAQLTEFVRAEKAGEPTVSRTVSRTAENSAQLSEPTGTEYAAAG